MANRLKIRLERLGLILAFIGLAAILQPFSLAVYTSGFYIIILGGSILFVGSTLPEESKGVKALIRSIAIIVFLAAALLLAVYLAPLSVS